MTPTSYNVYKNMSEYISTVPECFPKEETDPSIAEGKFDVSFAEYKYHFEVVGQSVVVHCMKTFEEWYIVISSELLSKNSLSNSLEK